MIREESFKKDELKNRGDSHLKPNDDWNGQIELFSGIDNSLRDDIALHNPAKNVHKNGFDFGVA
jgi:hypothetical protein